MSDGRDVVRLFDRAPLVVRLHVATRWRLFPFPRLASFVPAGRTFVDIGCGYGLWALYLAGQHPSAEILGFDPDRSKTDWAGSAASSGGFSNLRFETSPAEELVPPECDLVSLIDVMYLIPYHQQELILAQAVRHLRPGGVILLKEMSRRPRWKYAWNWLEEWLAVRALRITQGNHFFFRPEQEWEQLLQSFGLRVSTIRVDAGYIHPHILFLGEKPSIPA